MSMDDVKRKVRSLLTVAAAGSGATDPERETARRLADQLMAKHGLTEAEIPQRQSHTPPPAVPRAPRPTDTVVVNVNGQNYAFNFNSFFNSRNGNTTTGNW